jgi:hypothetical protein
MMPVMVPVLPRQTAIRSADWTLRSGWPDQPIRNQKEQPMTGYCSRPFVTDALDRHEREVRKHRLERALRPPSMSSPSDQDAGILTRLSALLPRRVRTSAAEGR